MIELIDLNELLKNIKENRIDCLAIDDIDFSEMDSKQFAEFASAMVANTSITKLCHTIYDTPTHEALIIDTPECFLRRYNVRAYDRKTYTGSAKEIAEYDVKGMHKGTLIFELNELVMTDNEFHRFIAALLLNRKEYIFIFPSDKLLHKIPYRRFNMILTALELNQFYHCVDFGDHFFLSGLDPKSFTRLLRFLENTNTQSISFRCFLNQLSKHFLTQLADAISKSKVKAITLDPSISSMTSEQMTIFAEGLAKNKSLQTLGTRINSIIFVKYPERDQPNSKNNLNILLSSLSANTTLTKISTLMSYFDERCMNNKEDCFVKLIDFIEKNKNLTHLGICKREDIEPYKLDIENRYKPSINKEGLLVSIKLTSEVQILANRTQDLAEALKGSKIKSILITDNPDIPTSLSFLPEPLKSVLQENRIVEAKQMTEQLSTVLPFSMDLCKLVANYGSDVFDETESNPIQQTQSEELPQGEKLEDVVHEIQIEGDVEADLEGDVEGDEVTEDTDRNSEKSEDTDREDDSDDESLKSATRKFR